MFSYRVLASGLFVQQMAMLNAIQFDFYASIVRPWARFVLFAPKINLDL